MHFPPEVILLIRNGEEMVKAMKMTVSTQLGTNLRSLHIIYISLYYLYILSRYYPSGKKYYSHCRK